MYSIVLLLLSPSLDNGVEVIRGTLHFSMFEILRGQGRTVWTVSFLSSYPLSSVFCPSRPSVWRGRPRVLSRAFSFSSPLNFPHPLPLFPSSRVASCLSAPRGGEIWLLLLRRRREGRTRSFFAFWDHHHHHLFAAGPPSRVLPAAGSYREERKESGDREREREREGESARGVEES